MESTLASLLLTPSQSRVKRVIRGDLGIKMLAAVPAQETRNLELFQLALRLVEQGRADIPAQLATYFDTVLKQALLLAKDPTAVSGKILPESIQLALELKKVSILRSAVDEANTLSAISRERAKIILESLERHVATSD
jgi:hypothetical protein